MAHGFSATRSMTADRYAESFTKGGLAVLLYDHLGFGASGGQPRREINTWLQTRGYLDAVSFAATLPGIDPGRIGLWGDSLSGGVALVAAALDARVAAIDVQVPALGGKPPPPDPDGTGFAALKDAILSGNVRPGLDEVEGLMPVVSDDQARRPVCAEAHDGVPVVLRIRGRPERAGNEITRARLRAAGPGSRGFARRTCCPALFVVSPQDEMPASAPAVARKVWERLGGPREWQDIEGGHFGLLYWPSELFDQAASAQVRFLRHHLMG
jgi:fermentation-respiration switch protein FrsA (DUF1100 family)